MQLFWEKGFEATGKRDLMAATGVASQSLYNTFGDKRSLYLEALRHYVQTRAGEMLGVLKAPGSPLENVKAVIRKAGALADDPETAQGCFLCNTLAEFGQSDEGIREFLGEQMALARGAYADALGRAQQAGELDASVDAQALASALLCASQGLALMQRAGRPAGHGPGGGGLDAADAGRPAGLSHEKRPPRHHPRRP